MGSQKRHLRNFLLNKRYQLRYTLALVLLSALIMTVLGALVYYKQQSATQQVLMNAQAAFPDDVLVEVKKTLAADDQQYLMVLIGSCVGLAAILTLLGIVFTHRVAGPLYKMTLYFRRVKEGDLARPHPLRKGDHLLEFYAEFKEMHDAIRAREEVDVEKLTKAIAALEGGTNAEALSALVELKQNKEKALSR